MVRRPRRSAARALRPRQEVSQGRPGRGALDARRADAFGDRAGGRVRRQPHDRQPGAARAPGRGPGRPLAGRRHLRRAAAPPLVHPDHPRPARGDRVARPSPPCRGAPEARGAGAARARRAARPGDRRAGVPFADRPPRQRRAAAMRGPLRQPGLRPRLPRGRLHPDHADPLPARGGAALGGAVRDRGERADGARRRACSASSPATPASSSSGGR